MKKNLPFLITLLILIFVSIFTVCFFTLHERIIYTYSEEYKGYLVSDIKGISNEITIPSTYKDKNVVGIGQRAFYKNERVKKINFEDESKIKIIEKLAFSECSNLESFELVGTYNIERNAFSYATSLKYVKISPVNLGASVFYGDTNLEEVLLGDNLKNIGTYAFSKTKIEILNLPKSLKNISYNAFIDMPYLKEISLYKANIISDLEYLNSLNNIKINDLS